MSKTTIILDPQPDLWQPGSTIRWDDLAESRLVEHPGHGDQKVHGRRGGGGDMAALDAELRGIRGAERIVAIDPPTGKIMLDKGADGLSVNLEHGDDVMMIGTVVSHNHPSGWDYPVGDIKHNGNGPSIPDLETAWRADVAEMRIVTPTRVISIKPGSDTTWGGGVQEKIRTNRIDSGYTAGEIAMHNSLVDIDSAVRNDFYSDISSGKKSIPQAEIMHADEVLSRAAETHGWKVTETRNSDWVDPMNPAPRPPEPPVARYASAQGPGGGPAGSITGWTQSPEGQWSATESIEQRVARQLVRYAVRLMEHPGHGSEKVHGRKGSGVDISGTQLANISEKTRGKMSARAQALGVPSVADQAKEITDRYNRASDATKADGMKWYGDAHKDAQLAGEVSGYGLQKSAAVFAVNSPQRHWDANRASALETMSIIKGDKPFEITADIAAKLRPPIKAGMYKPSQLNPSQVAFGHPNLKRKALSDKYFTRGVTDPKAYAGFGKRNHEKAIADGIEVLRGQDIDAAVGGTKVRNFYNNIYDPRSTGVTVDDWAYRAAIPDMHVTVRYKDQKTGESRVYDGPAIDAPYGSLSGMMQSAPKAAGENYKAGLYPITAEAYTVAAAKIGILPSQLQAIVWVQIREVDKGSR